uniref:COR domain-containing protein n=1 Tax=Macrostomum lignano TaxID=282301 RepID=A0A1I8HKN3_9PLAT
AKKSRESVSDNECPTMHQGFSRKNTENTTQPAELPQLPSSEFYIRMLGARSPPRGDLFDPQINATELRATVKLLWAFLDLCKQHNIQARTGITASLHGMTDVDMLMREADKRRLIEALKGHPDLRLRQAGRWKVSSKSHCLNVARHGCWPFIDLSFYELKDGWVVDLLGSFGKKYRYPETFERYPKVESVSIDCKELALTYPFVCRVPDSATSHGGVLETLTFSDGGPVYTVPVNEPKGVINAIYSTLSVKN